MIGCGGVGDFSLCKDQHRPVAGCYTAARFSSSEVMRGRGITQCKPDGPENTGLMVQQPHSPELHRFCHTAHVGACVRQQFTD